MKNGDQDDSVFSCVIEQRVRKTAQQNAPECPMNDLKRERALLRNRNGLIESIEKIVAE